MTDITEIKVPDITPSIMVEFIKEVYYSDKKAVNNTEFNYSEDKGNTQTGKTEENGVLMVKMNPASKISLSLAV